MMPATVHWPKTAFTFDVFFTFQLDNVQGKLNAYNYWMALEYKSNNGGIWKDRYEQFLIGIRIWRHLKIIKCSGQGHDPAGVDETQPGECAIECPACPQPGKNLPMNWAQAPESKQWLYAIIWTIDVSFCLKLKDKKITNDIALRDGWAHWVPETPYKQYISKYGHQVE
ncbi:hypothetical protein BJ138DRAFT_984701, partial [Hygrophoropsis aurantiaca]